MDIDKLISEAFVRHKAEERMTFQSLVEMVSQVMHEEDDELGRNPEDAALQQQKDAEGEGVNSEAWVDNFLGLLKKHGYEAAKLVKIIRPRGSPPRAAITNLGTKAQRLGIGKILDAEGIKWAFTTKNKSARHKSIEAGGHLFDLIQGDFTGSAKGADDCEVMNSTAFEGNLIYGILYVSGKQKEAEAYLEKNRKAAKGIVCTQGALQDGIEAAKAIKTEIERLKLDWTKVSRSSGGEIEGGVSLTKEYTMHGASSDEAKADISVGGVGVSVKKIEASQFMSAQGPEMAAIMDVAMNTVAKKSSLSLEKEIGDFTASLQRAIGSEYKKHASAADDDHGQKTKQVQQKDDKNKPVFDDEGNPVMITVPDLGADPSGEKYAAWYASKEKLAKATGESDTLFGKLITKAINIDDLEELSDDEANMLKDALEGTAAEGFLKLRDGVKDILGSEDFKAAICKEGITGYGKFNEQPPKAQAMLKWSEKNPSSAEFVRFYDAQGWNEGWFKAVADRAKLEIRERGNATKRGSGTRAEMDKYDSDTKYDREGNPIQESINSFLEEEFSAEDLKEVEAHSEELYSQFMEDQLLLQEGAIWDAIKGAAGKAKEVVSKVWKRISDFIARAAKYIKNLFQKGFSYLTEMLGFEVVSVEVSY
jgi:hypothetical protein